MIGLCKTLRGVEVTNDRSSEMSAGARGSLHHSVRALAESSQAGRAPSWGAVGRVSAQAASGGMTCLLVLNFVASSLHETCMRFWC